MLVLVWLVSACDTRYGAYLELQSPREFDTVEVYFGQTTVSSSSPAQFASPLLGAAFDRLLARRHLTLLGVYERGYDVEDVYQLAEQLMTWDERVILWRFLHLKVVERIIGGNVIGTQGTPVEVLGKRIDVRFFPELWLVRDEITRRSRLGADGHGTAEK